MMRTMWLGLMLVPWLSGCATFQEMQTQWQDSTCNYDGAYRQGVNDAQEGELMADMQTLCAERYSLDVAEGYRTGYAEGKSYAAAGAQRPVTSETNSDPERPQWKCRSAYGKRDCGYRCVTGYGDIACAKSPDHHCIKAYGEVRCGLGCEARFGEIECHDEPVARAR